jgi:uncharacterized protein (TIGR03435 family)
MDRLATMLTSILRLQLDGADSGRLPPPVINETGITGVYDIGLDFVPLPHEDALGDLQRALQRYGLKLVPQEAVIDLIVVQNVSRPSAN